MNTASANVDQAEVNKFEQLAARWWDPNSEFKPLHQINPLRLDYIDKRAALAGKRVIDVGCGGGILAESMAKRGAVVTGIDAGQAALTVAKLHALEANVQIDYQQTTAEAYAAEHAGQFEVVTCLEMLEHVPDPAAVIRACAELAQPGAELFFSTINRNPKAYALAIVGAEYLLKLLPKGTHDYRKFIRPSELGRWLRGAGLDLVEITGMSYNPLTRQYKLGKDMDVNYLVHARKA
ncbi:bifunctional 3-demethylubiquinone 3-O-methyltransferase/2-octaprenyl-6-hydroxy phenol methylase [Candidatus Tenderia electrophaga]|jgi:2-polyprenyl-6-hydroxyphenyl methylase/3-demethylubiquinone-9 3-methyltransferase|uniref:Ubiquinone biosynthesis O-methyltransferase n=1 Tax=Candidatus Tenderia electrophaga TaxID=1748243 RepID=A0A0S2TDG5_9GAMM|nr:bifunctional 3-demethylubiquinone 3-O-methyltransferase/2-octaprenyl-6-hydroxy phenol methylase [Candidatus Tenderia electrophaga]